IGLQYDRQEVLVGDHANDQGHALGLDKKLVDAADLEDLAGFAHLGEDEGELHAHGVEIELAIGAEVVLEGNAVQAHDEATDAALDIVDYVFDLLSEHRLTPLVDELR